MISYAFDFSLSIIPTLNLNYGYLMRANISLSNIIKFSKSGMPGGVAHFVF